MVTTTLLMSSLKRSLIIIWKVVELLVKPKNITRGSKRPQFILKAAFYSSPSLIHTLLYPQWTTNFMKYLALACCGCLESEGGAGIIHSHCIELSIVLYQA